MFMFFIIFGSVAFLLMFMMYGNGYGRFDKRKLKPWRFIIHGLVLLMVVGSSIRIGYLNNNPKTIIEDPYISDRVIIRGDIIYFDEAVIINRTKTEYSFWASKSNTYEYTFEEYK